MKKIVSIMPIVLAALLWTGCQKPIDDTSNQTQLLVSNSSIATNAALAVRLSIPDASQGVLNVAAKWMVSPSTGVQMDSVYSFRENTLRFTQPGTYTITAAVNRVPCSPEAQAHPGMDTCYNSGTPLRTVTTSVKVN